MLGSSLADDAELLADVCIVGGGPAGLTIADELVGSGLGVLVLEAGAPRPPSGGEAYDSGRSVGLPYDLQGSRARGLGGTAHRWELDTPAGGPRLRLHELDELDLQDRPGLRSPGWPFSLSALEPYYARARTLCGVGPSQDDVVAEGPVRVRRYSFGEARVFTDVLPRRLEADALTRLVTGVVATEILPSEAGTTVQVLACRTTGGSSFSVRAQTYVLAGGGIENARLLLASRSRDAAGVGNAHDLVGRHFMEHPHFGTGLVVPADLSLEARPELWDVVLRDGQPTQATYVVEPQAQRARGLLNAAYFVEPRPARQMAALTSTGHGETRYLAALRAARAGFRGPHVPAVPVAAADAAMSLPLLAANYLRQRSAAKAVRSGAPARWPRVFTLVGMAEQAPSPASRVCLADSRDRFGVPDIALAWTLRAVEGEELRRSHDATAPALARYLGARVSPRLPDDGLPRLHYGFHHMGTTRMSTRAERGVVDADLRVHGIHNLFLAGSGAFPTSGAANPTLTIVALSVRLADRLRAELTPLRLARGAHAR